MKKLIWIALLAVGVVSVVFAATLTPYTISGVTLKRGVTPTLSGMVSPLDDVVVSGTCYVDSTVATVQDLTSVTQTWAWSFNTNGGSVTTYATNTAGGTNGVFAFTNTVPSGAQSMTIQMTLSDTNGKVYHYPSAGVSVSQTL